MKTKKVAIILVSASLAMGTVGTMTVFADPPAMSSEMPQAPNGQASQAPDGQAPTNIVKITAIENGNATVEIRNMTGKPDEANSNEETSDAETKNYDFSSAEIVKESNGKKEAATLSDITADSMVELELNEDGSVKTVIIKEKPEGQAPDGKAPNGQAPDNKASTNQTSEEKTSDNTAS